MTNIRRYAGPALALVAALAVGGCDLDLTDPNNPTEDVVNTDPAGIRNVAVGLQAEYANEVVDPVYSVGLIADEIGAGGATFEGYQQVDRGEAVANNLDISGGTWAGMYDVVLVANTLLENAPNVALAPGTRSGIIALAKFYKGLAYGQLLQLYERIPLDVDGTGSEAEFASRAEGIAETLRLLTEARQELQATPPSSEFLTEVVAPGFDLENSIDAMIARFSLMFGDYAQALAAAQRVDQSVLSVLTYTSTDTNPMWGMWYNSGNAYQMRPEDDFRLEAEPGDERVDYWVIEADIQGAEGPLDLHDRYAQRDDDYPVYLPDEMKLIMAEVHARNGDLATAIDLINDVRTQCASPLDEPVACLDPLTAADLPTQEAVLDEILRQRRYELFLQAVRYSDLRRFDEPLKYEWIMVPRAECDRNPSAPGELCQLETPPA